jgi:DNA-binding transcriptional LysR family regulator
MAMAERVLLEIGETARRLTGQDARLSGVVRLTTTESLLGFVAPALKTLHDRHPHLIVEVIVSNTFFTLTHRDADIALRPSEAAPEDLVARRLATIQTAVYASPSYMKEKAHAAPLSLDWLSPDESLAHLRSTRWIAKHIDPVRVVHRSNSLTSLREAARAGLGLAPLPCFLGDVSSGLVRVLPPIEEMATGLWLLTHPDLRQMQRLRTVMETISGYVVEHRHALEAHYEGTRTQ